jgi:hypothetical protein
VCADISHVKFSFSLSYLNKEDTQCSCMLLKKGQSYHTLGRTLNAHSPSCGEKTKGETTLMWSVRSVKKSKGGICSLVHTMRTERKGGKKWNTFTLCLSPTSGGGHSSSRSSPARTLVLVPSSSACCSSGGRRRGDLVPPFWPS